MQFHFDDEAAETAVQFFRRHLRHVDGADFAGKPFDLLPWQEKIVRDVFGWKREDGSRRYRTVYIEIPRKNGKSALCSGLALYMLLCDKEPGAQVYSAAGDRGQARIVFDVARKMIEQNPRLGQETELYQHRIVGPRLGGFYTAVSAEAYSKHGFNASAIIFDELHVQPNRDLWDVLTTSVGARRQPLTVAITTAGHDRQSICWEMHLRAKAANEKPEDDPYFYGVIYGADDADDWRDEAVWAKANPSLGYALKIEYLREKCQEAINNPAAENTFRNLHLNQWTEQAVRAIPMHCWDACKDVLTEEDLRGEPCYVGLDLASTRDVAALVAVFPREDDKFALLPFFFAPEEAANPRAGQDRAKLAGFLKSKEILPTPGNETAYAEIASCFQTVCETYDVRALIYDPWNAAAFIQRVVDDGFPLDCVYKFPQTISNFAEPTGRLISLVKTGRLIHSGNRVLRWMAANLACKQDASGNLRPDKEHSADKIDGIVASIMGLARAMIGGGGGPKFYDTHALEIG